MPPLTPASPRITSLQKAQRCLTAFASVASSLTSGHISDPRLGTEREREERRVKGRKDDDEKKVTRSDTEKNGNEFNV